MYHNGNADILLIDCTNSTVHFVQLEHQLLDHSRCCPTVFSFSKKFQRQQWIYTYCHLASWWYSWKWPLYLSSGSEAFKLSFLISNCLDSWVPFRMMDCSQWFVNEISGSIGQSTRRIPTCLHLAVNIASLMPSWVFLGASYLSSGLDSWFCITSGLNP